MSACPSGTPWLSTDTCPTRMNYLEHLRDIQTLGIIACLLESYRRGSFATHVSAEADS